MSKKTAVNVVVVLAVVAAVAGVIALKQRPAEPAPVPVETPVQSVEEASVAAPNQIPTLVDLGAGKCIPCKKMAPILDALKEEYVGRMHVVFHDVWKDPEPARRYGIRLIPTQVFLDPDGKELFRHEGFYGRDDILGKWKALGYPFENVEAK